MHLRERYGLPVMPIVVYLKVGLDGLGVDTVIDRIFEFEALTYRYFYVGLPGLNAEDYLRGDSWLGVALSALMNMPKDRIVALGTEAMDRIAEATGLNDEQKYLLGDCVEAYLDIDADQAKEFHRQLELQAAGRVNPMNKTRYDLALERGVELGEQKGRQEGQREGRQEGTVLAFRAAVAELLEAKIGSLPESLSSAIDDANDASLLRAWLIAAGRANTLAEFVQFGGPVVG